MFVFIVSHKMNDKKKLMLALNDRGHLFFSDHRSNPPWNPCLLCIAQRPHFVFFLDNLCISLVRKAELSGRRAAMQMQLYVKVSSCMTNQQG
jgi:hypothetical protein